MLSLGVLSLALCAAQVLSLPVSSLESEDDTKVMKCIVEVISDTLSKPNPVPITQDCLETLRGDERIISILRHQNLLKELQELAAQGAMERIQKVKKNRGYEEELSGVLGKQDKAPASGKDALPLHGKFSESEEVKRQPEDERKASSERSQEEDSAEELESNEISKREETPEDEIDNHITDEINHMEPPKDNQEDASDGASEEEAVSKKDPEEIGDHDKEDLKQESNETENEEDDTQREDNSMRIPEDARSEAETSKESQQESEAADCSDDETAKDLEDSKRWNKMDELAKELRAKRCAKRDTSEEDPDRSMRLPVADQKYEPANEEREDRQQQQASREDTEPQMSKRPEERKEEEGSANRKTEEQELESLAAIEAELENVAHKLHDLRRG
ncbi:PREDICTED: chromogranin-A [Nanorana parkeri]|uniref:chromogranin-A n=1 Tax=Nanorana parkeri TaxID=125878 RepID=UPI0008543653|nr:PREDICTED: chromogranin-A [Nanorana parkeri]